jgi:hypothetical protein
MNVSDDDLNRGKARRSFVGSLGERLQHVDATDYGNLGAQIEYTVTRDEYHAIHAKNPNGKVDK